MLRDIVRPINIKQDSNGILLFYDNSRSKYISSTRPIFTFGIDHRNITDNRWMLLTGRIPSNNTGYKIPRKAIITSITVQTENLVPNCSFNIMINDSASNPLTISLVNEVSKVVDNLNTPLSQGDWIQILLLVNSGNVDFPIFTLELAWVE